MTISPEIFARAAWIGRQMGAWLSAQVDIVPDEEGFRAAWRKCDREIWQEAKRVHRAGAVTIEGFQLFRDVASGALAARLEADNPIPQPMIIAPGNLPIH